MTVVHRIPLDPSVPQIHERELASRVFFVSEAIEDFSLLRSDGRIVAVEVAVPESIDVAELGHKLRFVAASDVLGQRPVEPKVVWRGNREGGVRDVFDDMVERGIAFETGEGQVAVGEPFLSLLDWLDARIAALAVTDFGAREYRYPTLLPTATLRRCGYFRSFPQFLMFVARLHGDVETYREFADRMADGGDVTAELRTRCDNFDYCLPPTMCFHTYHQLADRALPVPSLAITSRGKSFRYESRYRRSLERLWDFTIREIVFVGSQDYVAGSRRRLMERGCELVESLGLGGRCEVAADPFFADSGTAERVWSQRLLELKYELRLPLDSDRDVAVASFNFHEQYFGSSFAISTEAGPAYTSCAGFGLERLAYAFLCRHGLDPGDWPADVRKAVLR